MRGGNIGGRPRITAAYPTFPFDLFVRYYLILDGNIDTMPEILPSLLGGRGFPSEATKGQNRVVDRRLEKLSLTIRGMLYPLNMNINSCSLDDLKFYIIQHHHPGFAASLLYCSH
jgi:hypothetical protein